jgi:myo-inositol-1-phosphate synthase
MLLHAVRQELEAIQPMKAVFDRSYVSNLDGQHIKQEPTKAALAKCVMDDIENFKEAHDCARMVVVWCGSTEKYLEVSAVHETIEAFEQGLQ